MSPNHTLGPRPGQRRHAGEWVLIEARMQLIAIGDTQYDGISPKTALDHVGRFALLPAVERCLGDGDGMTTSAVVKGRSWSVRVEPVRAPVSGMVLAVQACYVRAGQVFPPLPMVGAWECEASPPGPDQVMRAYWSRELYRIHDVAHQRVSEDEPWEGTSWEGPRWLDELVVPDDRAATHRVLVRAIQSRGREMLSHYYRAQSPDTGAVHLLRLVGRRWADDQSGEAPPWWWRGVTLRTLPQHARGAHRPAAGPLLNATLSLSRDPLFAVDVPYEHVYLTSDQFAELDLAVPTDRHLPAMCHPDDLQALRAMLAACTAETDAVGETHAVAVRLAAKDGSWRSVVLSGVGVELGDGSDSPHVLCRVDTGPART